MCAREGVRIRGGAARMTKPSPIVTVPPSRQREGSSNLSRRKPMTGLARA